MFCPKCGSEFEVGFTRCETCETDLVESLPTEEEEYTELVLVFEGDAEAAAVVRGKLESAGIEAWIEGEGTHGVFPSLSPGAVQVRAEDEAAARQTLADAVALKEDAETLEEETPGDQA